MTEHRGEPLLNELKALREWLRQRPDDGSDYLFTSQKGGRLMAHSGPTNDGANLRPLIDAAQTVSPIGLVLADAEFDSELNHTHIRQRLHACSVIPAKRGKRTWNLHGVRAQMRSHFPRHLTAVAPRWKPSFRAVKRKLSARAPRAAVCLRSAAKRCCWD